jgi:uncharacterized protein Yka (UPF0111/DUF47 family)
MSLAESFLNTARDMLMMSENIKRLESRVDRIADDVHSLDRRVMKIELMIDLAKQTPRNRTFKKLP